MRSSSHTRPTSLPHAHPHGSDPSLQSTARVMSASFHRLIAPERRRRGSNGCRRGRATGREGSGAAVRRCTMASRAAKAVVSRAQALSSPLHTRTVIGVSRRSRSRRRTAMGIWPWVLAGKASPRDRRKQLHGVRAAEVPCAHRRAGGKSRRPPQRDHPPRVESVTSVDEGAVDPRAHAHSDHVRDLAAQAPC